MKIEDPQDPVSIVIVGHVDHGKSTFIGRFLFDTNNLSADKLDDLKRQATESGRRLEFAHVMDQFREEREQNITIDTAQTFFNLEDHPYVFVDAPGHKEYLKNMITGATQARNALLLLDVKEGIREQTEKHARILKLLHIENLVVLINKMDLADYNENVFRSLEKEIRAVFKTTGVSAREIIPISAYEGDNIVSPSSRMPWYQGPTVIDFIKSVKPDAEAVGRADVRFPVQLVQGTDGDRLLLGRVESGRIESGMTLIDFPTGETVVVKKVAKFEAKTKAAGSGESVAIVTDRDPGFARGHVLCSSEPPVVRRIRAHFFWASPDRLEMGRELILECRTQRATGRIEALEGELTSDHAGYLEGGDIALVTIETIEPILLEAAGPADPFSRFVCYDGGAAVGCGVVDSVS